MSKRSNIEEITPVKYSVTNMAERKENMMEEYQKECRVCKKVYTMKVKPEDIQTWKDGAHIQYAMPYLTADERELLVSGICGKCFDEMFAE